MEPDNSSSFVKPTSSLSRRDFLRLAGVAGLGVLLSGCNPLLQGPSAESGKKVQLVYQDTRDDWFLPMAQEMLKEFHDLHPDTEVFFLPEPEGSQSKEEKMLADMQAGIAPDVFQGCCSWFPVWAQKGHTLDLRPYVAAELDKATIAEWDPAQYNALFTNDGKHYALPKYHGALALYYNKDLFDRYGVSYPHRVWTHEDYLDAMRRLTHDTNGDGEIDLWGSQTYITWDRIQVHVNAWGGHLVDPADPGKSLMGEPEALEAQEWLRARMWDEHVMATPLDVQNMWPDDVFISGKIAMLEEGSWRLKHILSNADFRVGVAPFPAGPARKVTLTTTDGYAIYAGTKQPQAAWELIKFLTGVEYGRAMAKHGFMQPARASIVGDWIRFIQKEFPEQTRGMDLYAFADGHIKGYSVVAEVAANMAEATHIANAAWDQVLTLGKEPVDILKDAARQIDSANRGMD